MKLHIGDYAVSKVNGKSIVEAASQDFETQLTFEIIGVSKTKYLLALPLYYSIKNSFNVTEDHVVSYGVDPDYLDTRAITISEDKVYLGKLSNTSDDGMFCGRCNSFVPMAEPNQKDGTMRCYECRSDPYR